ncbi:hypothetical protein D3C87_1842100 [compost metagenome]
MLAQERIDLFVRLHAGARLDFRPAEFVEGLLAEDLARQPHAMAEFFPVFRVAHIVEADDRVVMRIGGTQRDIAARLRQVVADMCLKTMAFRSSLAIIGDGDGQEMVLDVRLLQARR